MKRSCPSSGQRAARYALGKKTCFLPKKFTNDQKCSIFFEICAEGKSFSTMLLQGSLSQDVEGIRPFSSFQCLGQPSFEHLRSCLTYVHSSPIMVFHVPEHVLIFVSLGQQPLQMSIDPEKHSLSLNGYQITGSLMSQVAVFMDPPQLIESVVIL